MEVWGKLLVDFEPLPGLWMIEADLKREHAEATEKGMGTYRSISLKRPLTVSPFFRAWSSLFERRRRKRSAPPLV